MGDAKNMILGLNPFPYQEIPGLSIVSTQLYALTHKIEFRFQSPRDCKVTHIGVILGAVIGSPAPMKISLQNVLNGYADGTYVAWRTYQMEESYWEHKWKWFDITNTDLTRGQYYAIVIEPSDLPIDGWNSFAIDTGIGNSPTTARNFPGMTGLATGGVLSANIPIFALKDTDGNVFGNPIEFLYSYYLQYKQQTYSYPEERAIVFQIPGELTTYAKIAGIVIYGLPQTSTNKNFSVIIYDQEGAIVGMTQMLYGHYSMIDSIRGGNVAYVLFDESVLSNIYPDRKYYVAFSPNFDSTESYEIGWDYMIAPDERSMLALPMGSYFWMAERGDRGSPWEENTQAVPICEFIISEWGSPVEEVAGVHLKFTPKWNDNFFIQHADDMIDDSGSLTTGLVALASNLQRHEMIAIPIGDAIESYSGYLTAEVFLDPDSDRSEQFIIIDETEIEKVKTISIDPWVTGTYTIVFRLRAAKSSANYKEVIRYLRVIAPA